MSEVFDEVWLVAQPMFGKANDAKIHSLRATLARRIIRLARDGNTDRDKLRSLARRAMLSLADVPNTSS